MREVSGASALSRFFRTHILETYADGEITHAPWGNPRPPHQPGVVLNGERRPEGRKPGRLS